MLPKHVRYQAALHPGAFFPQGRTPQATHYILHDWPSFVNGFFSNFLYFSLPVPVTLFLLSTLHNVEKELYPTAQM